MVAVKDPKGASEGPRGSNSAEHPAWTKVSTQERAWVLNSVGIANGAGEPPSLDGRWGGKRVLLWPVVAHQRVDQALTPDIRAPHVPWCVTGSRFHLHIRLLRQRRCDRPPCQALSIPCLRCYAPRANRPHLEVSDALVRRRVPAASFAAAPYVPPPPGPTGAAGASRAAMHAEARPAANARWVWCAQQLLSRGICTNGANVRDQS